MSAIAHKKHAICERIVSLPDPLAKGIARRMPKGTASTVA